MDTATQTAALEQLDALRATLTAPTAPPSTAVTIAGYLTREPEIRYTREGIATCQLNIATTDEGRFDVVAGSDLAENIALSLCKGMGVLVAGRLEFRTWETDEGDQRSRVEVTAHDVGPSLRGATVDVHKVERRGATA